MHFNRDNIRARRFVGGNAGDKVSNFIWVAQEVRWAGKWQICKEWFQQKCEVKSNNIFWGNNSWICTV